ncbi:RNI-like protein [Nemania sp. FL0916]|nr:RNI-like protein [Nemania sp. FL0916]
MDSSNAAQQVQTEKPQRRASFSPMKAIRSLSISSQISQLSTGSDTDPPSAGAQRRTLRKGAAPGPLKKEALFRKDSKSSTECSAGRDSTSTQPTTPSIISRSASFHGDAGAVIKSGPLQPEPSILKSKKEYLILTPFALHKFKNRAAAEQQFPSICTPELSLSPVSPIESHTSLDDFPSNTELTLPLERVVSAFKDEGIKPSFGLEIWWRSSTATNVFASTGFDFRLPDERDDWLKKIRLAVKLRTQAVSEERTPSEIELRLKLSQNAGHETDNQVDIYPVVPRRPYAGSVGDPKKNWREQSSFYLMFTKYSLNLAQFSASSNRKGANPSFVQFGLITLSRVRVNANDERFDLVFRLPLDQPQKLQLSSRYYRNILSKLFQADTYLKPAWPLWTRQEVFYMDDCAQQTPLPNGEDYGGFKTTLEAFIAGYPHCRPVEWTVKWKDVRHAPQFCLLKPKGQLHYSAHQLLAVLRALRFNEFFRSISFRGVDFSSLAKKIDNAQRLEPTIWLSRTGKHCLTRSEADMVEASSMLFQELVSLLLGSESIKSIDLTNVLWGMPVGPPQQNNAASAPIGSCEIIPPLALLWGSSQTRCNSVVLSGNAIGDIDAAELRRVMQSRPNFLRTFEVSRCNLDDASIVYLWEGLREQRFSLEEIDTSYNSGRIEASRIAYALSECRGLRRLNLAYTIRGELDGPLFRPWSSAGLFESWRLEDLDLSGWKLNFETLYGIMQYLELEESSQLRRLSLNRCGLNGDLATGLFCRIGTGRDIHLFLNDNPLETGSTDWIDLIHGNEAPTNLHLDMIQFQQESKFNRLLTALSHNTTIEFLSMVGTGPPGQVSSKTADLFSNFFKMNDTLKFLDLSGYSGKLEDSQLGWGLSGALGGLKDNTSLRQLRLRNHDMGSAEDVSELCRIIMVNTGLAMFDIQHNNFDHHQFGRLVQAMTHNHQLISFPISEADREYAINKEKRLLLKTQKRSSLRSQDKLSKSAESRLDGVLTWLYSHWESEAEKMKEILRRNRDDPANQVLELEGEYLEAWDDDDLPSWLAPKPTRQDKRPRRASEPEPMAPLEDGPFSPVSSTPTPMAGGEGLSARRASYTPRWAHVIEEEAAVG